MSQAAYHRPDAERGRANLIRASQASPETCDAPDTREYEGRAVSFAAGGSKGTGPRLNEFVLDLGSADEAAATFDAFERDRATADCGPTAFRTSVSFGHGPKGVGTKRFTFVSKPTIGDHRVTAIGLVQGTSFALLEIIGWPRSKPSPSSIAKKAAVRLS